MFKSDSAFEIRFASVFSTEDTRERDFMQNKSSTISGKKLSLTRGDYSPILSFVSNNLTEAEKNARNETEKKMIAEYVKHFNSGSLADHKNGSRYWIEDKGPIVETYIGSHYLYIHLLIIFF